MFWDIPHVDRFNRKHNGTWTTDYRGDYVRTRRQRRLASSSRRLLAAAAAGAGAAEAWKDSSAAGEAAAAAVAEAAAAAGGGRLLQSHVGSRAALLRLSLLAAGSPGQNLPDADTLAAADV